MGSKRLLGWKDVSSFYEAGSNLRKNRRSDDLGGGDSELLSTFVRCQEARTSSCA